MRFSSRSLALPVAVVAGAAVCLPVATASAAPLPPAHVARQVSVSEAAPAGSVARMGESKVAQSDGIAWWRLPKCPMIIGCS